MRRKWRCHRASFAAWRSPCHVPMGSADPKMWEAGCASLYFQIKIFENISLFSLKASADHLISMQVILKKIIFTNDSSA